MLPSPPETRASLILRLRDAADVAAWDEVVAIYGPLVYRMAQRQGLQPADADDVVQQVFAAVAQQIGRWTEQPQRGRFRSWLLGIARNIAINVMTRRPHGGAGVGGDDSFKVLAEIPATDEPLSCEFDLEYRLEVYRWAAEQVRESVARTTWVGRFAGEATSFAAVASRNAWPDRPLRSRTADWIGRHGRGLQSV